MFSISYAVADEKKFEIIDVEIFSLSKNIESVFDAPAATYVITSEDIRRSGITTIPDLFRLVPGIQVAKQGAHKWALSSRGFTFQFSNKLLVLIDGRSIYTPLFSGVIWDVHDLVLRDIDRIEVIRGPGGTIWGANAVNGIINIITKDSISTQTNYFSSTHSDQGAWTIEARNGGAISDDLFYRVYAKHKNEKASYLSDGSSLYDQWQINTSGFRFDIKNNKEYGKKDNMMISGDIRKGVAENYFSIVPTLSAPFKENRRMDKETQGGNIIFRWNKDISNSSDIIFQTYLDYDNFDVDVVGRQAYTLDLDFRYANYNQDIDNQFTWGLGYRYIVDDLDFDGQLVEHRFESVHQQNYNLFIQNKYGFIPDKFYITAGTKFEHNDDTGLEWQPSLRFAYYPSDTSTLWGAVSRAVRTPSRSERSLTFRSVGTPAGYLAQRFALGDYQAEKLVAYEAGYRKNFNNNITVDTAIFFNDYDDLRTSEIGASTGNIVLPYYIENNGFGETYGVEVNGKWHVKENWKLEASYSFFKIDIHLKNNSTDTGPVGVEQSEGQSPANQFNIRSGYNITPNLEWDNTIFYVGNIPDVRLSGIDSYIRCDSRINWKPLDVLSIGIAAQNIFDDQHPEFYSSLYSSPAEVGRSFYLNLALEL